MGAELAETLEGSENRVAAASGKSYHQQRRAPPMRLPSTGHYCRAASVSLLGLRATAGTARRLVELKNTTQVRCVLQVEKESPVN